MFCLFRCVFDKLNFRARFYIKSKQKTLHGTNVGFHKPPNWLRNLIFTGGGDTKLQRKSKKRPKKEKIRTPNDAWKSYLNS